MMLGVQRPGVTLAAGELQRAGLIQYSRGNVKILDHAGLIKRSCECYGVSKREFDRLLGMAVKTSSGENGGGSR
jgi:Mn-dependent DtxR family transcriptional regulator